MKLRINDREVTLPSTLAEITLGQRIAFHEKHGKELEETLTGILEMEEGFERSMAEMDFTMQQAIRSFAFFTGSDIDVVRESDHLSDILALYHACLRGLLEDEEAIEIRGRYDWKGEEWELFPPVVDGSSAITFGEFIDSKNIVQQLNDLGNGRWESLQALCAIYLRKAGEAYDKSFAEETSERYQMMAELPMDIAIEVAFFLSSSLNSYLSTSAFLTTAETPEGTTAESTLSSGVGSTS